MLFAFFHVRPWKLRPVSGITAWCTKTCCICHGAPNERASSLQPLRYRKLTIFEKSTHRSVKSTGC